MKTMEGGVMTNRRKRRKQRERMLETLIITTFVAICVTLILSIGYMYTNFSIHRNECLMEALSTELINLQQEVDEARNKQNEYKKQVEELQAQLSKYQEIVIPESMTS